MNELTKPEGIEDRLRAYKLTEDDTYYMLRLHQRAFEGQGYIIVGTHDQEEYKVGGSFEADISSGGGNGSAGRVLVIGTATVDEWKEQTRRYNVPMPSGHTQAEWDYYYAICKAYKVVAE